MEQRRIDIARLGLLAGLLLLITVVLYIPSFHGGFVWDDAMYITGNPIIKAPDGLHRFWFTTEAFDYYPLTWTLWWIEWRVWGESTFGYHVVSVLLHAVDALLLWLILRRLRIPGAWFAALLFSVHPVNVATVAWISEQKNTLSMFFCAVTIFFYLDYEHEHRRLWYVLSLLTFTLALLSKSAVVMLPVALLGCIWWRRRNVRSNDLWHCLPFFVLSLIFGTVTVWFQYTRVLRGHSVRSDSFFSRLLGAASAVWFYVYKTLLPFKLSLLYPKSPADPAVPGSYVPFLALLLFFGIVWWKRKTWGGGLLFGFGYFVIMLLPVLGFIDQNFYQYSLVADHWQYYSMIGIIVLLVAGAMSLFRGMGGAGRYAELLLGAVIVLALGTATWARIPVYADSEALWRDAVLKNPQAWAAHNNLGNVLMQAGRLDDARQQYEQALHIEPFLAEPHNNLGTIFVQEGKLQDAIVQYEEALEVKLDFAEAQNNLGAALLRAGSLDEAIPHIAAAVQLNPNYDEARYNLAVLLASRGRVDEAIAQMQTAVRQEPGRVEFQQKLNELERLKSAH